MEKTKLFELSFKSFVHIKNIYNRNLHDKVDTNKVHYDLPKFTQSDQKTGKNVYTPLNFYTETFIIYFSSKFKLHSQIGNLKEKKISSCGPKPLMYCTSACSEWMCEPCQKGNSSGSSFQLMPASHAAASEWITQLLTIVQFCSQNWTDHPVALRVGGAWIHICLTTNTPGGWLSDVHNTKTNCLGE